MGISATTAAVWSTAVATVSAISAFVALSVTRTSLRQSVKPELHLDDWCRSIVQRGHAHIEVLRISTLKNVGRGVAMHVYMNLERSMRYRTPLAFMSTVTLPLIAAGESRAVEIEIPLLWENVKEKGRSGKSLNLRISVLCSDTINRRHETTFDFVVIEKPPANIVANVVAPGVALTMRSPSSRSVRALYVQRLVSRIPGLGWIAPR